MKIEKISYEQQQASRMMWGFIADIAVIDFIWALHSGIGFNAQMLQISAFTSLIMLIVAWFYTYKRPDQQIRLTIEIVLQMILFSNVAAALSYFSSTLNMPLRDDWFVMADTAIGLPWKEYVAYIASLKPELSNFLGIGYISMGPQFILIVLLLFVTKNLVQLQQLILGAALCSIVAIVIAAIIPAAGAYVHYNIGNAAYERLSPITDLFLLREGKLHHLPMNFQGIIQFPSCHSAFAVMFIFATWSMRWLRLLFVPLNILLILSTPVFGGHYIVDTIAGVLIAVVVIYYIRRILPINKISAAQPGNAYLQMAS